MAKDSIKVVGLNQAIRAIKTVGVPAKEVAQAGFEAGQIVAGEARSLVPVKTGALKNTIRVAKQQRRIIVRAGNNTTVPYANPIHWGWFRRNIRPNEFFGRAIGGKIEEVYKAYFQNLQELINKYSK